MAVAILLAGFAACAGAQQVYRIVGPDGRITFSDKPPADPGTRGAAAAPLRGGAEGSGATLPFELRQAATRYPVTLYSGPDCPPCNSARSFLASRGIPFAERTVSTQEDLVALHRLSGRTTLPFLTIGAQQLLGFSDLEWTQFLDAAGYPKTSQLPPGYRAPAPLPLVTAAAPQPATAPPLQAPAGAQPRAPQPAPAPAPAGSNPAGIQF
jgi:glutaredoxin